MYFFLNFPYVRLEAYLVGLNIRHNIYNSGIYLQFKWNRSKKIERNLIDAKVMCDFIFC